MFMSNKYYLASKDSSKSDPMYRYQVDMPIFTSSGKKGNMYTYFDNSESFSTQINTNSQYIGKYISNQISCPFGFDKDRNCIYFKGVYATEILLEKLDEYIKIYILCDNCDYPEINLKSIGNKKNKKLLKCCKSCGKELDINIKNQDKTFDYICSQL